MKNSNGFQTLIAREYYRFARLSKQTIAPPIISTLLFIFVFGYSLGSKIKEIEGFPYIVFILPGLAAMGILNNSYANSSTSLFMARMDRSIENILSAPLSSLQIVGSFILGGVIRGLLIGLITLGIALFVHMPLVHPFLTLIVILLISLAFSCLGIISGLWSESWDQIATFTNFIITPFIYLGAVFYSILILPPFWQKVSLCNPIFYMVDALRYATLGKGDVSFTLSFSILLGISCFSFMISVYLFKKGYKMIL